MSSRPRSGSHGRRRATDRPSASEPATVADTYQRTPRMNVLATDTIASYCTCCMCGMFGGHHAYMGRMWSAALLGSTCNFCCCGQLVDGMLIPQYGQSSQRYRWLSTQKPSRLLPGKSVSESLSFVQSTVPFDLHRMTICKIVVGLVAFQIVPYLAYVFVYGEALALQGADTVSPTPQEDSIGQLIASPFGGAAAAWCTLGAILMGAPRNVSIFVVVCACVLGALSALALYLGGYAQPWGESPDEHPDSSHGGGSGGPPFPLVAVPAAVVILVVWLGGLSPPAFDWTIRGAATDTSTSTGIHSDSGSTPSSDRGSESGEDEDTDENEDEGFDKFPDAAVHAQSRTPSPPLGPGRIQVLAWSGPSPEQLPRLGCFPGLARTFVLVCAGLAWWTMVTWVMLRDQPMRVPLAMCDEHVFPQWKVSGEQPGSEECRTFVGVLARRWIQKVPAGFVWVCQNWDDLLEAFGSSVRDMSSAGGAEGRHLEVLGLQPGAEWSEVRGAYRRLARELHPDKQPPGQSEEETATRIEKFHAVRKAYEELELLRGEGAGASHGGAPHGQSPGGRRGSRRSGRSRASPWGKRSRSRGSDL